jgi:anaerobic selenocysteine-containing dehydrogenase
VRAIVTLVAATGNACGAGRGILYVNGPHTRGMDANLVAGEGSSPTISHMDLVEALADPARTSALVCWNNNVAASNPRQRALRRALRRPDLFTVVIDVFPTDTVDFADVVLPAASFLEFDDVVASYFHHCVGAQVRAVDPPDLALPNQEIFRRLASAMGFDDPWLHEPDPDLIARLLEPLGITFAELAAHGVLWPVPAEVESFPGGVFSTRSGKLRLAGPVFERHGLGRAPSPQADPPPPPGQLRLLSPADPWTMSSSYGNSQRIRTKLGALTVTVHPDELSTLGLRDGDPVRVRSDEGALEMVARSSTDVPRGVALCPKGRWPKVDASGANVNWLTAAIRTDIGDSSAIHSTHVRIEPS